jgi:signal peptidase I
MALLRFLATVGLWATRSVSLLFVAVGLFLLGLQQFLGLTFTYIESNSMSPTWHRGDYVVSAQPFGEFEIGVPVIRAGPGGANIAHRVVAVLEDGRVVTRGDASSADDLPVDPESIGGVVTGVASPWASKVLWLYYQPLIVLGGLLLLAISLWLNDPQRRPKNEDETKTSAADGQPPTTPHESERKDTK